MSAALPPRAPREARDVSVHGDRRIDEYHWLRDRDDPRTLAYLEAENAWADAWFAPHAALEEQLYQEMLSRIQQDDDSVPMRKGAWWYSTQTRRGEQYPHYLRRRAIGPERRFDPAGIDETLLDLNALAHGKPFLRLGVTAITRDAARLAYSADFTGGRDFTLFVKELGDGTTLPWSVEQVASAAWANDSRTLYYVTMDETKRAHRLWRHVVGAERADELLFEEPDELFDIGIGKTLDESFLLLGIESKDSTEWRAIDAEPRRRPAVRDAHRVPAPTRHRIRPRAPRRPLLRADQRHRPQLPAGDGRCGRTRSGARRRARRCARARACSTTSTCSPATWPSPSATPAPCSCAIVDLEGAARTTIAFDEPAYNVHTARQPRVRDRHGALRLRLADTPARPTTTTCEARDAGAAEAPAGPGATTRRSTPASAFTRRPPTDRGSRSRWSVASDRRAPAAQPAPALRLRQVRHLDRPVVLADAASRCSIAAWSSRSPTSAAAASSADSWHEAGKMASKQTTFTDFIACAEALVATRPDGARRGSRSKAAAPAAC